MSSILHALSSTFTTCACGAHAKNCAITQMAAFVDGEIAESVDLGPLVGARRGFRTKERVPFSGGLKGVEMCDQDTWPNGTASSPAAPVAPDHEAPVLSTLNGHDANGESAIFASVVVTQYLKRSADCFQETAAIDEKDAQSALPVCASPLECYYPSHIVRGQNAAQDAQKVDTPRIGDVARIECPLFRESVGWRGW